MTLPSDTQRAPSDQAARGMEFALEVDETVAMNVSQRPSPVIHVWRNGQEVLRGSPEDTGAKVGAHHKTTQLLFSYAVFTDLPTDHPDQFTAFRFRTRGKLQGDPDIMRVMRRFDGWMILDPRNVEGPPGWRYDADGRGWSVMEMQRENERTEQAT